jgi:hypothetical protein
MIVMREKLIEFFNSPKRNGWIFSPTIDVYIRKGRHLGTDHQIHSYLDIANIVVKPEYLHQGHFKAFLALCQEIQPYDGILFEIVLDDNMRAYLRRLAQKDQRWTERGEDFLWENVPGFLPALPASILKG